MGKLIEKLNRIGRSGGPRLGFGQSGGGGAPQLAIIASLDAADRTLAKAVVANGADAVVVSGSGAKAPKGPAAKKLGLNDAVPCGGGGRASGGAAAGALRGHGCACGIRAPDPALSFRGLPATYRRPA